MLNTCAVVTVIRNGVEVRINESDYDPSVDKLAGADTSVEIDEMTATQLRQYAKENGIDVTGLKSREQLLAAISPKNRMIIPTSDGKFQIIDEEGVSIDGVLYDTQQDAEAML